MISSLFEMACLFTGEISKPILEIERGRKRGQV
jgi:hypothetical protein